MTLRHTAPSPARAMLADRVDAIDGLRAVAMTMVIAGHCSLLSIGWTGVWLFYAISGYVIMRGFIRRPDEGVDGAASGNGTGLGAAYGAFLLRRFWRIVPLYLLYIAINLFIGVASGVAAATTEPLPWLLSFTFNWHMIAELHAERALWSPYLHLWSLSVEQQFYLVFPLLILSFAPDRHGRVLTSLMLFAMVARVLASLLVAHAEGSAQWRSFAIYLAAPCHFDAFSGGALVAWISALYGTVALDRLRRLLGATAIAALLAYSMVYAGLGIERYGWTRQAMKGIYGGTMFGEGREVFLYAATALCATWAISLAVHNASVSRVLALPSLRWVGRVSYGGYVFHVLVIWGLAELFGANHEALNTLAIPTRLLFFAAVMVVTLTMAGVSFAFFEEPVRKRFTRPAGHTTSATPADAPLRSVLIAPRAGAPDASSALLRPAAGTRQSNTEPQS